MSQETLKGCFNSLHETSEKGYLPAIKSAASRLFRGFASNLRSMHILLNAGGLPIIHSFV